MSVEMLISDLKSKQLELDVKIRDLECYTERVKDMTENIKDKSNDIYYLIQNIEFEHRDEIEDAKKC